MIKTNNYTFTTTLKELFFSFKFLRKDQTTLKMVEIAQVSYLDMLFNANSLFLYIARHVNLFWNNLKNVTYEVTYN